MGRPNGASSEFELYARELIANSTPTMRDIVQYDDLITRAINCSAWPSGLVDTLIYNLIRPMVCFLQATDRTALERIEHHGAIDDGFLSYVLGIQTIANVVKQTIDGMHSYKERFEEGTPVQTNCKALVRDLLLACVTDENVSQRIEALSRLREYKRYVDNGRSMVQAMRESWTQ